ncbi:hypothetical protein ABZ801_33430 [Actinomadura sp. NPDC047616]|uniref:hypothetical protein n=1 Tax=Actinomadura sp. NPDC047616 TaxID=3155914 RepID=UPI00340C438E
MRHTGVRLLLDIRQRRGVRGPEYAWANSLRLQAALAHARIAYEHHPQLAPATELRRLESAEDDRQGRQALAPRAGGRVRRPLHRRDPRQRRPHAGRVGAVEGVACTAPASCTCWTNPPSTCTWAAMYRMTCPSRTPALRADPLVGRDCAGLVYVIRYYVRGLPSAVHRGAGEDGRGGRSARPVTSGAVSRQRSGVQELLQPATKPARGLTLACCEGMAYMIVPSARLSASDGPLRAHRARPGATPWGRSRPRTGRISRGCLRDRALHPR